MLNKEKQLGQRGEDAAARYLEEQCGYTILDRNYGRTTGEIDIIAKDGDTWVFIEVKTRTSFYYGWPSEAVEKRKQRKMGRTAEAYLYYHHGWDRPCRFDVIEIIQDPRQELKLNHIKNAFWL